MKPLLFTLVLCLALSSRQSTFADVGVKAIPVPNDVLATSLFTDGTKTYFRANPIPGKVALLEMAVVNQLYQEIDSAWRSGRLDDASRREAFDTAAKAIQKWSAYGTTLASKTTLSSTDGYDYLQKFVETTAQMAGSALVGSVLIGAAKIASVVTLPVAGVLRERLQLSPPLK